MPFGWRQAVLLPVLVAVAGCHTPLSKGKSPLMPAQMWADSAVLDVFSVRYPHGDATVNEKLWEEIDEQQFSPELRERLTRNGFRVGLVGSQLPVELSKLMELSDKPAAATLTAETKVENLESQPRVTRHHLQLRAGQRAEIEASGVYPELPVLVCESGKLCGQPYNQAQGMFAVKCFPQPDGRVRLELTPELHHDQSRVSYVSDRGMFRLDTRRPRRTFDDMQLSADLPPGAMLVLGSLPNRPGSLGYHFFTEKGDHLEQKLLVVRLSQTQHDGLFNRPEPLALEE
jgi:hypothetical protein